MVDIQIFAVVIGNNYLQCKSTTFRWKGCCTKGGDFFKKYGTVFPFTPLK